VNNFSLFDSALIRSLVTSKSRSRIVEPGKCILTTFIIQIYWWFINIYFRYQIKVSKSKRV
jgi:hypothetical protein